MKFLKGLAKFFLYVFIIFLICILLVVAGVWGYQKYKHHQVNKELEKLPAYDETLSYDYILDGHLDEKIGDDKMTVQEKLDKGLNPFQIDSSGNGLSDYEAIHKYDTDPTKFSTAEDGISDYVKIEEGLDPNKKIEADDIDTFKISKEDMDATLTTNDLNAKYFTKIESYNDNELDELYQPVRDPVRVKNYEGKITLDIPKDTDDNVEAYYFDFDEEEMVKIKKQQRSDDKIEVTIDQDYPIYLFDSDIIKDINEYYYFRISLFQLSREILGFDHHIFIFKRGLFTDDLFQEEEIEDIDYGIIKISRAEISRIYAWFLDGLYATLDAIFKPLDDADANILTRALFDYGKLEGTPEYAQRQVMPWLYEEEELETENENSKKVIDSGFRLKHHSFPFGNFVTEVAEGGVCAGISRTTEYIYNDADLEYKLHYKPEHLRTKFVDFLGGKKRSELQYDISGQSEDYPFLEDGELFDYRFTDDSIKELSEDNFVDPEVIVKPDELTQPDQSLTQLLETQWIYSNEQKHYHKPKYPTHISVLDQVEDYLEDGQIIYASLNDGGGGHTVSIYKMEYDRYDPDLIRLYVYDPNFPYEKLKEYGKKEVYMEVYKKEETFPRDNVLEYFEFDYTPMKEYESSPTYSTEDGYNIMLFHNDTPIDRKD